MKERWWHTEKMNTAMFTKIVEDYHKLIFTVCHRFVRDYQEAENLTQETFLIAFQTIDNFIGDNYKPWLVKIATNKSKDYLKSAYVQRTKITADEEMKEIPTTAIDVSLEVEEREKLVIVKQMCEELKEPYRQIAVLHFVEEKSFSEIAEQLNVPIKTVQTQTYRARDKLKPLLKEALFHA